MSYNIWLYTYANPINQTDPSGLCVFCQMRDRVRVDARPKGELTVYAQPNENSHDISSVSDKGYIEIDSSLLGDWRNGWRRVALLKGPGVYSSKGWVRNNDLLDNCGPQQYMVFGCMPLSGWTNQQFQGFGPSETAYINCGTEAGYGLAGTSATCPYSRLRGLHNGLDFFAPSGRPLVWAGSHSGQLKPRNTYPGDAVDNADYGNIVIAFGSKDVLYGHVNANLIIESGKGTEVRPGQTIGLSGWNHLHFSIRKYSSYYNPLNYFSSELAAQIHGKLGPYPNPYNAYSMAAFSAAIPNSDTWKERWTKSFWYAGSSKDGIAWGSGPFAPPSTDCPE
jgi:murein DD-endopeptidase MepM/ murein hydrolase activator NlpD